MYIYAVTLQLLAPYHIYVQKLPEAQNVEKSKILVECSCLSRARHQKGRSDPTGTISGKLLNYRKGNGQISISTGSQKLRM